MEEEDVKINFFVYYNNLMSLGLCIVCNNTKDTILLDG